MPIYEYDCRKCGIRFEELIRSPDEKPECPECGSPDAERCLSLFGLGGTIRSDEANTKSRSSCSSCSTRKCSTCH